MGWSSCSLGCLLSRQRLFIYSEEAVHLSHLCCPWFNSGTFVSSLSIPGLLLSSSSSSSFLPCLQFPSPAIASAHTFSPHHTSIPHVPPGFTEHRPYRHRRGIYYAKLYRLSAYVRSGLPVNYSLLFPLFILQIRNVQVVSVSSYASLSSLQMLQRPARLIASGFCFSALFLGHLFESL